MSKGLIFLLLFFVLLQLLHSQETRKRPAKPAKPGKPGKPKPIKPEKPGKPKPIPERPVRPIKPKGCEGTNGDIYKKGKTVQDGCFEKTCMYHKKKKKYYWKKAFMSSFCCQTKGAGKFIEHGHTQMVEEELFICHFGELLKTKPSPIMVNNTMSMPKKLVLQKIEKVDKICTQIVSLEKSAKFLVQIMGSKYKRKIHSEISKIVQSHEETDYACGLRDLLSLIQDRQLQDRIVEALEKEGFEILLNPSEDTRNQTRKESRVVQGIPANLGQFPWQARLNVKTCHGNYVCGGVLISPCYVLTARHCVDAWETDIRQDITVTLGDLNRRTKEPTEVTRNVYFVHFHPDNNYHYDVAILLLTQAPPSNNAIQPIPMALDYPGFGQQATVSGWGRTETGSSSNVLRFRDINMPSFWWCHQYIADRIGDYGVELSADEMCAGSLVDGDYAGACHGDSGGPLAWRNPQNNQWELVGIVKRGVQDCPAAFEFGVYTSVVYPPVRRWIENILETQTDPGANGECRCNAQGTKTDALQPAGWDTANCLMEGAPPGCSGGGFADIAGRQFVDSNRFYINPHKAVNCPDPVATFDTCNCNRGPDLGTIIGVCLNPSWGTGNIFNSGGTSIASPDETCAFDFSGDWYFTPQGTVAPAICPNGEYDGANCLYYTKVPSGSQALLWPEDPNSYRGYFYGYPQQLNECDDPCFPPNSKVMLMNGARTELKNIHIGDKVLAMTQYNKPVFSKFLGWIHRNDSAKNFYLQIHSHHGSIKISPYHLLLIKEGKAEVEKFVFAKDVSLGQLILQKSLQTMTFTWAAVTKVTKLFEIGLLAPLTEEGTIVVDDTVASCYAEISSHEIAHAAFYPVRLVPSLLETQDTQDEPGIRTYAKSLIPLGKLLGLVRETIKTGDAISVDHMAVQAFQTAFTILGFMLIQAKYHL